MTRLILWRHGQTGWNADNRVQGQTDIGLSELGLAQARAAAPDLAALRPDVIVASDLRRVADTTAPLAELTGLTVSFDQRLRERAYGEWQGHTVTEIQERWPAGFARWRRGEPVGEAGVEDNEDVSKRMIDALVDAAGLAPGGTIVVGCHGGAARQGAGALLGWPEAAIRTLGGLSNCHWTELWLSPERGWTLVAHNVGALSGTATAQVTSE